jgi:hypothetical protein
MNEAMVLGYFAKYNTMVWPMQVVVYLLCFVALYLAVKKIKYSDRIIAATLAFFWLWNGIVFFPPTGAASMLFSAFAVLFVIQGILFLIGVAKPFVSYRIGTDIYSIIGIVLILYGLIGSPLVGALAGHLYPKMALVGLFPCPLLTFTFGFLLCTNSKVPTYLLVIPLLWGLQALIPPWIGMWEDVGMILGAIVATAMLVYRDRKVMLGTAPRPA